ncbi:MAG: rhomboid family intramembrane serine protease [Proteobacteria bacterium]|nr:rhomboid family intramembrane serine protease [Pseudomonadota bacterium]
MDQDLRVVFESRNRQSCADRALVLSSLQIPYQLIDDGASYALVVPAAYSAQAVNELQLYDEENPPVRPSPVRRADYQDPVPGLVGYVLVICIVAGMAGYSFFQSNWVVAGRVDGELIRNGELWRLFTALTLHSSVKHLLGNIVFGVFFGLFAGRLLGSGVAWLAIVLAAATGNAFNTLLLESSHRSIGASTAVFAALGIVAGYVWRGKLMNQDRWSNRYGPIVGGLALLMYTGTGGPNTDIGAHLLGFVCGFAAGMILIRFNAITKDSRTQLTAGAIAFGLVFSSWIIALTV